MESMTKFVGGIIGGGTVSSLLLFVFKGQNKKIERKVDITRCKIIERNFDKITDEIKSDIKDIKASQEKQLVSLTESATTLTGIKEAIKEAIEKRI